MSNDQPTKFVAGSKLLPSFEEPPLEEVVFGVQFEPLKELTGAHAGLFWPKIRDRYPLSETHPPVLHQVELLEMKPSPNTQVISVPVVPRNWFVSQDKTQLVQMQRDHFIRNWRRIEGGETYPRFHVLIESFKKDWLAFSDFVKSEQLGEIKIDQCELTYINHIDKGSGWTSFAEVGKVFSFFKPTSRSGLLADPETLSWSSSFKLPDQRGRLSIEMGPVFRGRDFKMVLALTIRARGAPAGESTDAALSWLEMAHEWVVSAFDDLTEPAMHAIWKKQT